MTKANQHSSPNSLFLNENFHYFLKKERTLINLNISFTSCVCVYGVHVYVYVCSHVCGGIHACVYGDQRLMSSVSLIPVHPSVKASLLSPEHDNLTSLAS